MRKSSRNPQLLPVRCRKNLADPLPIGCRTLADIDRNIKHFTLYHAHQLALRLLHLVVQATQDVLCRLGVVVLHELDIEPGSFLKGLLVVTLVEKATLVTENLGFEHDDIGDGGWCGAHQNTFSLRTPIRYWPYWFFSIGWASFSSC